MRLATAAFTLATFVAALSHGEAATAASCAWDGSSGAFTEAARWSCGQVPGPGDIAVIEAGAPMVTAPATVGALVLRGGALAAAPGATLTALGTPHANLLGGESAIGAGLSVVLRGATQVSSGLALQLAGTLANEGTLGFEELPGDGGYRSMMLRNPGTGGVLLNRAGGHARFSSRANILLLGGMTLRNEGTLVLHSDDPTSPLPLALDSGSRVVQAAGLTVMDNVRVGASDASSEVEITGGDLAAEGTIQAAVRNSGGTLRPGPSCATASVAAPCPLPGFLNVQSYVQGPAGTLELQLAGNSSSDNDDFQVEGEVSLAGRLEVRRVGAFEPNGDLALLNVSNPIVGTFDVVANDFAPAFAVTYSSQLVMLASTTPPPPPPPGVAPAITSASPGPARVGIAYAHQIIATGTPAPGFGVASGTLPTGLTLSFGGLLSGTPTRSGTFELVIVADNGTAPAATQAVSLRVDAGDPTRITVSSGANQVAVVGQAFAAPLQVLVRDARGNAVPGVAVAFAAPAGGPTAVLASGNAVTDAAGLASVVAIAAGGAGSYAVTATVSGVTTPATFALSNLDTARSAFIHLTLASPSSYGRDQPFRIRARDSLTGNNVTSGTIDVKIDGQGVCIVTLPDGPCYPAIAIEPGAHALHATLSAPAFEAPILATTFTVTKRAGNLALASPASARLGATFTVRAALDFLVGIEELAPEAAPPSGTLRVMRGSTVLCQSPVTAAGETGLDCTVSATSAEPLDLVARFEGDARFEAAPIGQRVIVTVDGGLEVGDIVPDFEVFDAAGQRRTLREFAGKYVMLDFCAAWCGPCQAMGYNTGRVRESFAGQPFEYVTVIVQDPAQGVSAAIDAQEWASEHPFSGPILHRGGIADPAETSSLMRFYRGLFPTDFFPTLVLLDPQQRMKSKSTDPRGFDAETQVGAIATAMGIPAPALAPATQTSGLSQARLAVRSGGQSLVSSLTTQAAIPGGAIVFTTAPVAAMLDQATMNRQPYDEPVVLLLDSAGGFALGAPLDVTLDRLAWPDLHARNLGSMHVTVNDAHRATLPDGVLAGTSLTFTVPALGTIAFVPPLPAGTPVVRVAVEFRLDVDFARTSSLPPPETAVPARLVIASGNHQVGFLDARGGTPTPFGAPLAVRVTDSLGRGVPGQAVAFAVVPAAGPGNGPVGNATLAAPSALTDADGVARMSATPTGTAGRLEVQASVPGVAPVRFDLTTVKAGGKP